MQPVEGQIVVLLHISGQDTGTCKQEENKINFKKEPLAMVQTLAISVRLCCHVAYGTRQTVSLFPVYPCSHRDDRSKSMFVSRQQASGRLSGDLGGKGEKGRASCCSEH